ncbi:hypothetical protein BKA61DRAFT_732570 [Leptodontidium sp. MPI-SDFR-AT-0119]|nr:hypothetical protein BKA61DRAFT_732570 [Leptodontidium sp. MPI-SDFR-AT-0119]
MQISTFLAFLSAFIATATATSSADNLDKHRHGCLTKREVNILRSRRLNFFVNFDATLANQSFVDDFKLYSEGNKLLIPGFAGAGNLSVPQYDSKASFITGQLLPGSFAHNPNKTVDDMFPITISDHGCDSFTFRWVGYFFQGAPPVAAIDFVFVQKGSYLIEKAWSEYDSGGFLKGVGCAFVGGTCGTNACEPACAGTI